MSFYVFRQNLLACLAVCIAGISTAFAQHTPPPQEAVLPSQLRWVAFDEGSANLPKSAQESIKTFARKINPKAIITVTGQADDNPKLALARTRFLVNILKSAGISSQRIIGVVAHTPQQAPSISWTAPVLKTPRPRQFSPDSLEGRPLHNQFDILLSDGHLAVTLVRWGWLHGYQVQWLTPIQVPVTGDLTLDASNFSDAIEQVMVGLRKAGYPLSVRFSGKVIQIESNS
ncbi:MAG: TcpQ domain-containing protein [Burkholderiales bacterium]